MASITRTANPAGVSASSNVATYSTVDIGAAASNRIIVVVVASELAASTPSGCTIDYGSGDTAMTAGTGGNFGAVYAQTYRLLVPTGTTATIKVTFSATNPTSTQNHIAVYRILDGVYSSAGGDGSSDMDATDPLTTGAITIASGGVFVAVAGKATDTVRATWANATEDLDVDAGALGFTTATRATALTTTAVTCTGGTNGEDGALSYLIFTDNTEPTVVLNSPADAASTGDLTPTLNFTGTDTNSDEVEYQIQVHTDNAFGTIADDFNRTDSSTLGGNWSLGPESIAHSNVGPQILSNRAYNEGTSDCDAFYSGASFNNAQFSQATLKSINSGTDEFSGVLVRASATDYVMVQANKFGSNFRMYWYNAGAYTSLGNYAATPAVNDVMRLEASGTTFYFYLNGVLRITGSDAGAPASGAPGIILSGSNADQSSLDDWSGGDTAVLIDALSSTDAGFTAGHPFPSGDATDYTVQSALTDTVTYYWRARAIDPAGSNTWGAWATTRSFVATAGGGTVVKDLIGGGFIPFAR